MTNPNPTTILRLKLAQRHTCPAMRNSIRYLIHAMRIAKMKGTT